MVVNGFSTRDKSTKIVVRGPHLVGGGWTNPFVKYACHIGSFSQVTVGMKINKYLKLPPTPIQNITPWKFNRTFAPWKIAAILNRSRHHLPTIIFQGRAVKLRECSSGEYVKKSEIYPKISKYMSQNVRKHIKISNISIFFPTFSFRLLKKPTLPFWCLYSVDVFLQGIFCTSLHQPGTLQDTSRGWIDTEQLPSQGCVDS